MPELPEVETVKNSLKDLIIGKKILNVEVFYPQMIKNVSSDDLINKLKNQTFRDIKRRGKFLIFILDNFSMVAHLRMEGKYLIKRGEPHNKHEHVIFYLDTSETLRYVDTRKFGVIYLFDTINIEDLDKIEPLNKLGIEPISGNLTKEYLREKFARSSKPIKAALLDQTIISGLGNIYADEVCYMCKLHPEEKVCDLDDTDLSNICINSSIVLNKAINLGGTTIRSFINSHEITGRFQNELLIHTKSTCPECNKKVTKIFVTGRGTYFCERCQKKKTYKIGITGGIGSGKSVVLDYLKKNHYNVISCDEIVHTLMKKDGAAYSKIVRRFSKEILDENGQINRKKLGNIVFTDPSAKKDLENITHPLVIKEIKNQKGLVFVETPLLFEANLEYLFDLTLVINTSIDNQIRRVMLRNNLSEEEAKIRINNQLPLSLKAEKADVVIDNNGSLESLYHSINQFLIKL